MLQIAVKNITLIFHNPNSTQNSKLMKVGITFTAFDTLNATYVKMLEEAKNQCDYLIVGLKTTIKQINNTTNSTLVERYIQLKACKYVNEIIPYQTEQDLIDILQSFHIDIRILGEEYKFKPFTGEEYCHRKNIKIYFNRMDLRPKRVSKNTFTSSLTNNR